MKKFAMIAVFVVGMMSGCQSKKVDDKPAFNAQNVPTGICTCKHGGTCKCVPGTCDCPAY